MWVSSFNLKQKNAVKKHTLLNIQLKFSLASLIGISDSLA